MKSSLRFSILIVAVSAALLGAKEAKARERANKLTLFGGVGISRGLFDFTDGSARSSFAGWGPDAELGADMPFSSGFGFQAAAIGSRHEVMNTLDSIAYAERGNFDSLGAKAGLYFENLNIGAGMKQSRFEITSVPSEAAQSKTVLKGTTLFYYGSFSFDYRGQIRAAAEGQYTNGQLESRTFEAYQLGLRLTILFQL